MTQAHITLPLQGPLSSGQDDALEAIAPIPKIPHVFLDLTPNLLSDSVALLANPIAFFHEAIMHGSHLLKLPFAEFLCPLAASCRASSARSRASVRHCQKHFRLAPASRAIANKARIKSFVGL
jgi:hypothetical protein